MYGLGCAEYGLGVAAYGFGAAEYGSTGCVGVGNWTRCADNDVASSDSAAGTPAADNSKKRMNGQKNETGPFFGAHGAQPLVPRKMGQFPFPWRPSTMRRSN
jgi:hypothetical protein